MEILQTAQKRFPDDPQLVKHCNAALRRCDNCEDLESESDDGSAGGYAARAVILVNQKDGAKQAVSASERSGRERKSKSGSDDPDVDVDEDEDSGGGGCCAKIFCCCRRRRSAEDEDVISMDLPGMGMHDEEAILGRGGGGGRDPRKSAATQNSVRSVKSVRSSSSKKSVRQ